MDPVFTYDELAKQIVIKLKDYRESTHKNTDITSVAIAGSPTIEDQKDSVLHYRLFLAVDDNVSVVIDPTPSALDLDMRQTVFTISTASTVEGIQQSWTAYKTFKVLRQISAEEVLEQLIGEGLHRYRFDETFSGCRYWCDIAIESLEASGILEKGSASAFESYIQQLGKIPGQEARYPMPVRKGAFY